MRNQSSWRAARARDFVTPTATVRVRYQVSDLDGGSVVEAGIDAFSISRFGCDNDCPWDLTGDGAVGTADLLDLLSQWNTDPGGPPDFNGDQTVGTADLLELLSNWGPCE